MVKEKNKNLFLKGLHHNVGNSHLSSILTAKDHVMNSKPGRITKVSNLV